MRLGAMLAEAKQSTPPWAFSDPLKQAGAWVLWGSPTCPVDEQGYPVLKAGQTAYTHSYFGVPAQHAPGGLYDVTWDGNGTVVFVDQAQVQASPAPTPQSCTVMFAPAASGGPGITPKITSSDPGNPVRNIRMVPHGVPLQTFRPEFLAGFEPFPGPIRFVWWSEAVGYKPNTLTRWCDRQTPYYASQNRQPVPLVDGTGAPLVDTSTGQVTSGLPYWSGAGVALEYQIELCNTLRRDGWFNIPHAATTEYAYGFAAMIRDRLAPGLCAYFELSNETWNYQYPGTFWNVTVGKTLVGTPGALTPNTLVLGKASELKRIFTAVDEAFAGVGKGTRYKCVLADELAGVNRFDALMRQLQAWGYTGIDAFAPACYTYLPGATLNTYTAATTVDQIFSDTSAYLSGQLTQWMEACGGFVTKWAAALNHPIEYCCYECGNELAQVPNATYNAAMVACQSDPQMSTLYQQLFSAMATAGITTAIYCHDFGHYPDPYAARYWQDDSFTSNPKISAISQWTSNPVPTP